MSSDEGVSVGKEIEIVDKKISLRQVQRLSGPELLEFLLDGPAVVTLNDVDCFEIKVVAGEFGGECDPGSADDDHAGHRRM
jgi:hypothetical protein